MSKIIGIDLGTTNSCVAVIEGGVPCIIENSEGERTTPSVVAFGPNDDVSVGQAAKRQAVTNPSNTLYGVKRLIGRKSADADVQAQLATSPFAMSAASNGDTRVDIEGKSMSPPEISARVLMKMKQASEAYLGEPVTEAVIQYPHISTTLSVKPPRTLASPLGMRCAGESMSLRLLHLHTASTSNSKMAVLQSMT